MSQSSWTYFKTQLQIPQGSSEVENRGRPINDREKIVFANNSNFSRQWK